MRVIKHIVAVASVLALVGCGDTKLPGTVKVTGKVLHAGKPVARATVSFVPIGQTGRAASGLTDESGQYQLTTFTANDGAVPGNYAVTVNPMPKPIGKAAANTSTMTTPEDYAKAMQQGNDPTMTSHASEEGTEVPPEYRLPATTPLKKNVEANGPNQFDLLVD